MWKPEATEEQIAKVFEELLALKGKIGVRALCVAYFIP